MLFRLLWHAGEYRIPDILDMTVFDCAIALGVDQNANRNTPYGHVRADTNATVAERLATPGSVMVMSPEMLAAAMTFAPVTTP